MHYANVLAFAATAQAVSTGFNYGNMMSDGYTAKSQDDYEAEFKRAQSITGTAGKAGEFTSARLYTMIEGGTSDTPISAIQAAINTKTTLLLGLWASVDQDTFQNELNALNAAIEQWGDDFTSLVVGISVGSEDLYRITPTGIENDAGIGADPDTIVSYIKQTRSAIQGTGLSGASIGHVDTWTAWVNGSNSAVVDNCDWLGMDTYPYFQSTVDNSIENANKTFWDAFDATAGSGNGKDVWITETGWPVSGKTVNQAVPSLQNAESYWQDVACSTIGKYNTWWYTLQDASPTTPNPSFGIVGSNLASSSLYDLTCKAQPKSTQSGGPSSHATATGAHGSNSTGGASGNGGSDSASSAIGATPTGSAASASASASGSASGSQTGGATQVGSAFGAAVLAVFGLVAAL